MKNRLILSSIFLVVFSASAFAQEKLFVFPQFADGRFPDGTYYRSTLVLQAWLSSFPAPACTLRLNGMRADFGSVSGNLFTMTVPKDGWFQVKTTGAQPFQSGAAVLTCSEYVFASVLFSFYSPSGKLGEATVLGVDPSYQFRFVSDQTEGSRVGVAIANDTDISHSYIVTLRRTDGTTFGTSSVTVASRSSVAKFMDELMPTSANQILQVEIRAADFSDFAVVGLRFTGAVFTTIPAN